jgi:hypothetical protein
MDRTDVRYEAEIARLRRELEARGGAGVTEPPEGSKPTTEYERPMYPPALGAPPLNGDAGMSRPFHEISIRKTLKQQDDHLTPHPSPETINATAKEAIVSFPVQPQEQQEDQGQAVIPVHPRNPLLQPYYPILTRTTSRAN